MVSKRKITRGDGITERTIEQTFADTPDEILKALEEWRLALNDPLRPLRYQIEAARKAYEEWRLENPDSQRGEETVPDLLRLVSVLAEPMEEHLKAGRAEWAMRLAGEIAETLALLRFKHSWEPAALVGDRFLTKASKGGKARAETFETRHYLIRADFAANLERLKDNSRAKEATQKKFDISRSQLNKILRK
jgi:hypothetical protein